MYINELIIAFVCFDFIMMAPTINYLLYNKSQNNNNLQLINIIWKEYSHMLSLNSHPLAAC
jgi:hypothetical protein